MTTAKETEDLKAQLAQLQKDVASLTDTFSDLANSTGRDLRKTLDEQTRELRLRAGDAVATARGAATDLVGQADAQIRNNPGLAIGVATGVGFLLGALLARR